MKKIIMWILLGAFIVLSTMFIYKSCTKNETDNVKFSREYSKVNKDNVFVYKNIDEIIEIIENGTGIIYFGFPECKWCQAYVPYVNEVAKDTGISEIYYYNIKEDRKNDTKEYKKIVELLNNYLLSDDNGNKRVYVPDITVIKNGEIIGHNNETSVVEGYNNPSDYWTNEKVENLKAKLKEMFSEISNVCTSCN